MSKLIAKNDHIIEEFITNPRYEIMPTGEIFRVLKSGKRNKMGTLSKRSRGENYIQINVGKRGPKLLAHRIVYRKFNGTLDPLKVINHINGIHDDNRPENLELVSPRENNQHAYAVLGRKPVAGHRKISPEIANEIRILYESGLSYKKILLLVGPKYGITAKSTISYIVNNKIWNKPTKLSTSIIEKTYNQLRFPK